MGVQERAVDASDPQSEAVLGRQRVSPVEYLPNLLVPMLSRRDSVGNIEVLAILVGKLRA